MGVFKGFSLFRNIRVYMFWGERGVAPAVSRRGMGTTGRYSSQKWHYSEVERTAVRYFGFFWEIQRFSWK
ncbi:hypothetical protein GCM10008018_54340 [Paenibacillus marchantiophytorum]|uniref:Uncharacterized protein n=1 Tax=Paenibacillus marchantiophytorum TaxID=1619310 RepID=A0ABQ1F7P1_9BACL|nr:hypothetical protein GCM10008018_54340 [Paenibacillus marchantiophytorum]